MKQAFNILIKIFFIMALVYFIGLVFDAGYLKKVFPEEPTKFEENLLKIIE